MTDAQNSSAPSSRRAWVAVAALTAITVLAYVNLGLYTVQPIGALPEGRTVIIWRDSGEPFFNSADALCLERTGGVSLLCRGVAMGQAPTDRILVRLPYMHWAYLRSTNGQEFDR